MSMNITFYHPKLQEITDRKHDWEAVGEEESTAWWTVVLLKLMPVTAFGCQSNSAHLPTDREELYIACLMFSRWKTQKQLVLFLVLNWLFQEPSLFCAKEKLRKMQNFSTFVSRFIPIVHT